MSIEIPIVYLPSSMDLVIFSTSSKSANDVDLLDLNLYWLSHVCQYMFLIFHKINFQNFLITEKALIDLISITTLTLFWLASCKYLFNRTFEALSLE